MKIMKVCPEAKVPVRATNGAAGFDLFARAAVQVPESRVTAGRVIIGRASIPTGIAVEIPCGYVGRIGARSGLSVENNIEIGAGWIDPDYRGEIIVALMNFGADRFCVERGMRIAQLFVLQLGRVDLEVVHSLFPTERADRGFGSTGVY